MTAGLFELRKDPITSWWVATVVDRAFHRDRFARPAEPVDDGGDCQNCRLPEGDGVRLRVLKDYAFHTVGTEDEARELDRSVAQVAIAQARATGSWRTVVAPPGEHRPLHAVGTTTIEALVSGARAALAEAADAGQTEYVQVVQNWGAQAGARTNHLCLDVYDLPQIPHRIAEELGGSERPRRDEPLEPAYLGGRFERGLRAVRVTLAVRGLDRPAPAQRRLRSCVRA